MQLSNNMIELDEDDHIDINIETPNSDQVDDDICMEYGEDEIEVWNEEEESFSSKSDKKHNTFRDRIYATPKSFGAVVTKLVNNLFENPEGRMTGTQRSIIIASTAFEAYRTIISSFLIVFVPQNCGGYSCTILENIIPTDDLEIAAISINTFMGVYFCILFSIERARESVIKHYFIADKSSPTDKEYLVKMLSDMKPTHRRTILQINRTYRILSQVLLLIFFINAGVSCVVIWKNYLNNTTVTVFITNTLFMINRIHKALKITSSGEYNIYSAYRSDHLLYNRCRGEIAKNRLFTE